MKTSTIVLGALAAAGAVILLSEDESEAGPSLPLPQTNRPGVPPPPAGRPSPGTVNMSFTPPSSDSGRSFLLSLGEGDTDSRESQILGAVTSGFIQQIEWQPVSWDDPDFGTVTIFCATDALRVGLADPIRVNARHPTAQRIADALGAVLPTSRMSDLAWQAAFDTQCALGVHNLPSDAKMSSTSRMIQHSDLVSQDRATRGVPEGGFARDNGKDWVNTERLIAADGSHALSTKEGKFPAAANFGWHGKTQLLKSPAGYAVAQSIGLTHTQRHVDYSQVVTLYRQDCEIGGASRSVVEILSDPDTAYLLSDEVKRGTACRCTRFPGTPLGVS